MKYQLTYLNIRLFKCGYRIYIYKYLMIDRKHKVEDILCIDVLLEAPHDVSPK